MYVVCSWKKQLRHTLAGVKHVHGKPSLLWRHAVVPCATRFPHGIFLLLGKELTWLEGVALNARHSLRKDIAMDVLLSSRKEYELLICNHSCEFKLPKYTNGKTQSVTHTLQCNIFPKRFLFVSSDHEKTYMSARKFYNLPSWTILLRITYYSIYWVTNEQCSRNLQVLVKEGGPGNARSNGLKILAFCRQEGR